MEHQPRQRPARPALATSERGGRGEEPGALIERIRAGDEAAFETLFRTYYEALNDFICRKVDCPEVAEGLVQNVFCNLWHRRQAWQPRHSIKAYLYGAARNEAFKYLRHRDVERAWQQHNRHQAPSPDPTPIEWCHGQEVHQAVQQYVEALPERRRLVFVLVRYHGLSHVEVASALGISTKTVEVQMWKALKFLRARLAVHLSDEA